LEKANPTRQTGKVRLPCKSPVSTLRLWWHKVKRGYQDTWCLE